MRMAIRAILTVGLMWGFFLVIGMAFTTILIFYDPSYAVFGYLLPMIISLVFLGIQFLLGPILLDISLSWTYGMNWNTPEQLPPYLADFVLKKQRELGISVNRVAIIYDLNPNAFTYGYFRKNARLVLTQGIFEYLDEEEQKAVVAHELGHIANLDFVWTTLAYAVPTLFYGIYVISKEVLNNLETTTSNDGDEDKTNNDKKEKGNSVVAIIAVLIFIVMVTAYLMYVISLFLALFASRSREYLADDFSAKHTKDPSALANALVKIAYGMFIVESKRKSFREKQKNKDVTVEFSSTEIEYFQKGARTAMIRAFNPLGIFDMKMARKMALNAISGNALASINEDELTEEQLSPETIAKAAAWDLYNPWGTFMELQSTHPLPAKRLKRLNGHAKKMGQDPPYPEIDSMKPPEILWDEFFVDLFFGYGLEWLVLFLPTILMSLLFYLVDWGLIHLTFNQMFLILGVVVIMLGLAWWYRKTVRYPKLTREHPKVRLVEALTDMTKNGYYEASPIRGKPICVEGKLIGRGIAGYIFSEDLMIKDETGVAIVDYQALLPLWNWYFAWRRIPEILGQDAIIWGWYYRTPYPVIKIWRMWVPSRDRYFKNWWAGVNTIFAILLVLVGLALVTIGFLPF